LVQTSHDLRSLIFGGVAEDDAPGVGAVMAFDLAMRLGESQRLERKSVVFDQRVIFERRQGSARRVRIELAALERRAFDEDGGDRSRGRPPATLGELIERRAVGRGGG